MEFDKDFLRWLLMIGAAPIWVPFLLALWRDFSRALRAEGGLFGREPRGHQLDKILRERAAEPDLLVSEPWVRASDRRKPKMGAGKPSSAPSPRPAPGFRSGPGSAPPRARGFR